MSYSDIVSDGGMDPRNKLDEAMYRHTVAQRDSAWREVEAWKQRYDELAKMLANHAALQRPPVILADKESYEAGRVMEREAMMQLFTDSENQPTQHGTVTVEYMQREIAAEREACAMRAWALVLGLTDQDTADIVLKAIRARGQA